MLHNKTYTEKTNSLDALYEIVVRMKDTAINDEYISLETKQHVLCSFVEFKLRYKKMKLDLMEVDASICNIMREINK